MKKIYFLIVSVLLVSSVFPQTWTIQQSNTTQSLWSVRFINNNTGLVCGTGGVILKTTNGGINWVAKTSGTTNDLMFMEFLNSLTGYCASLRGPLLKTTNAGETWNAISFVNLPASNLLGGGWFSDVNNGVIAYGKSMYNQSKILKTTNGGMSWDTVFTPPPLAHGWISYMHFPDSQNGYATVSYDTVYKTTNGGLNWTTINLGGNPRLWTSGVFFLNASTGFVGGGIQTDSMVTGGQMSMTTNGGVSWQLVLSSYGIAKIQFIDNLNGISLVANAIAGSGILIKTTNGGYNWSVFTTPMDSLNGMYFLGTSLGYAVGVRGRILRYGIPIGIQTISTEVPSKFSLSQNYPNPFNPSTKIRYDISRMSDVKLVIYDVMGREVQTIVNEKLQSGTYEASFDGTLFTSGIYYYKLIANDFSETRKMLMLK